MSGRPFSSGRAGRCGNLGHKIGDTLPSSIAAFGMYFKACFTLRWMKNSSEGSKLSNPGALPPMLLTRSSNRGALSWILVAFIDSGVHELETSGAVSDSGVQGLESCGRFQRFWWPRARIRRRNGRQGWPAGADSPSRAH